MIAFENEYTFTSALNDGIAMFLGSGFSVLARDRNDKPLPTGTGLSQELVAKFGLCGVDGLSLPQICAILEAQKRDSFRSFLTERFTCDHFDSRYLALDRLNIKTIFTTNIDDLPFKIYQSSKRHYLSDVAMTGPTHSDREAVNLVTLHGCVKHDNEDFAFSSLDLASSFSTDPDKWHFLTESLQRFPTLFWGYSLSDSGVLQALSPKTVKGRPHMDKWIVIQKEEQPAVQYFKALGFQIIIAGTSDFLDFLVNYQPPQHVQIADALQTTRSLFSEEAMPEAGSVPVRPLIEFYAGAAPTWHDIFQGQIHRTDHFAKIRESINSGRNTIVIGAPAVGKTTLMMQIAADIAFKGHKLITESLTTEKASLIIRKLNGEKALIFVDNFGDNIESFDILSRSPNVIVAGFDRDYNFDIISHRINRSAFNIIEVTDLSDRDIQQIFLRIPKEIRVEYFNRPVTEKGVNPSLYEVIEANIVKPSLQKRFNHVLKQLLSIDQVLHDVFVMCCYVRQCRTPVSFDMAYAFCRGLIEDYKDIYLIFDRLGALVADYSGPFVDVDQDYYTPRSTIVSEAVLSQVTHSNLKRVITRFHTEVSSFRIARYDVFKRRAFDANLMLNAFDFWEDGKEFYEIAYEKDKSPYLLQQGALYLAHRRHFREAFSWIDRAVLQSKYKIPSIRNSHAIILFNANISAPQSDPTVRQTLTKSMDILKECYTYDKRKTYHALTFADQALKYYEVYRDDNAVNYLNTAIEWLGSEKSRSPWNRKINRLYAIVNSKLLQLP